jgi:integrase/recombinase XerD
MIRNISDELTSHFRTYLTQLGYSESSVYMLPNCVKDFLEYHHSTDPATLAISHINQFYEYLQNRPQKRKAGALSEQYINHHVYALKVFFNWLEQTGQIKYNPISVMKFKQPRPNTREPLTLEDIRLLLESCTTRRETALLHLFYSCGLRRSEGEALDIQDIHFRQNLLYVREGKGAKRRVIPMTGKVSQALESYFLSERVKQKNAKDQEAFMLNKTGDRMRGDSYNKLLKTILQRTELNPEYTLHHLRHSIATHLLESGISIEFVRDFLGHSHLEATQIYAKVKQYQLKKL